MPARLRYKPAVGPRIRSRSGQIAVYCGPESRGAAMGTGTNPPAAALSECSAPTDRCEDAADVIEGVVLENE